MAFYLVRTNGKTYIANPDVNLKVDVYDLHHEFFIPTPGRMEFYCNESGKAFAFETDLDRASFEDITASLLWFGAHIGLPEVKVLMYNPISYANF
jgi:hypothetical protein